MDDMLYRRRLIRLALGLALILRVANATGAESEDRPFLAGAATAGIADAIVRAHASLRPAAAGHAAHPLPEEVFNRRWYLKPGKMPLNPFGELDQVKMNPGTSADVLDRPAGPIDPDITIPSVQDTDRRPLALPASDSLHYVGHTPEGLMSADYFGEFARLMPSRLRAGKDFVAMMANGSHGYLPTPEQHALGGYETWLGTNRVQKDASVIITRNLLEMLATLSAAGQ
jgi:hypothetical protein